MSRQTIAIVADSGSDVPPSLIEQFNIRIAPLHVNYTNESYLDGVDISAQEVYDYLGVEIPKTSLPSGESVHTIYEEIQAEGIKEVIVISISSGLSGTSGIFKMVAEEFSDLRIHVIDTKSIGLGSGIFAAYIGGLIEKGEDFDTIVGMTEDIVEDSSVYFSIPTLKYLSAGGRIGRVTSVVGSLLNINPIISCDADGIYYTVSKARGRKKSLNKMRSLIEEFTEGFEKYNVAVAYGGAEFKEEAALLLQQLKDRLPHVENAYLGPVSPALGVHTGPGLIGAVIQRINY